MLCQLSSEFHMHVSASMLKSCATCLTRQTAWIVSLLCMPLSVLTATLDLPARLQSVCKTLNCPSPRQPAPGKQSRGVTRARMRCCDAMEATELHSQAQLHPC